jgi:hypothetical protein
VTVHWIPAHTGVLGNEMADRAAKQATGWREHPWSPPIPPAMAIPFAALRSSVKMMLRKRIDEGREAQWQDGRTETKKLIEAPEQEVLRLHARLHRALSSALTQLRTKKIGFRDYLFSIRRAGSDECPCGWGRQTVKHILLDCLFNQRIRSMTIRRKSGVLVLSTPALAKASVQFVTQGRLLGQFGSMERLKE